MNLKYNTFNFETWIGAFFTAWETFVPTITTITYDKELVSSYSYLLSAYQDDFVSQYHPPMEDATDDTYNFLFICCRFNEFCEYFTYNEMNVDSVVRWFLGAKYPGIKRADSIIYTIQNGKSYAFDKCIFTPQIITNIQSFLYYINDNRSTEENLQSISFDDAETTEQTVLF